MIKATRPKRHRGSTSSRQAGLSLSRVRGFLTSVFLLSFLLTSCVPAYTRPLYGWHRNKRDNVLRNTWYATCRLSNFSHHHWRAERIRVLANGLADHTLDEKISGRSLGKRAQASPEQIDAVRRAAEAAIFGHKIVGLPLDTYGGGRLQCILWDRTGFVFWRSRIQKTRGQLRAPEGAIVLVDALLAVRRELFPAGFDLETVPPEGEYFDRAEAKVRFKETLEAALKEKIDAALKKAGEEGASARDLNE